MFLDIVDGTNGNLFIDGHRVWVKWMALPYEAAISPILTDASTQQLLLVEITLKHPLLVQQQIPGHIMAGVVRLE